MAAEHLSDDVTLALEKAALRAVNYIPGLHASKSNGALWLELAAGVELDAELIGEAIYWGLRLQFPRLRRIATHVISDPELLAETASELRGYAADRDARVHAMSEHNTDEFVACIECRPFSLEHTCILTPGRLPMCAARTYASVKASAYFASEDVPWRRAAESGLPMRRVFAKGALLDAERGEYAGCNQVYEELTGGRLRRVYLHSLRDYPSPPAAVSRRWLSGSRRWPGSASCAATRKEQRPPARRGRCWPTGPVANEARASPASLSTTSVTRTSSRETAG